MNLLVLTFSLVVPAFGNQFRHALSLAQRRSGECISLKSHSTFYTAVVQFGTSQKTSVNCVVDTGSDDLVIQKSKASPSTNLTGEEKNFDYGSGTIFGERAIDTVTIGNTVLERQPFWAFAKTTFDFTIEGILPLGPKSEKSAWDVGSFSMCFPPKSAQGSLQMGASQASIASSGQWESQLQSISVDNHATGLKGVATPDSGSTFLIAPGTNELVSLIEEICSKWSKCKESAGKKDRSAGMEKGRSAGKTGASYNYAYSYSDLGGDDEIVDLFFDAVKKDCGKTLPEISFDFAGGKAKIPGQAYVVSSEGTCIPALDYDYSFGFWIMGMPAFRNNRVHFNPTSKKIGFTEDCNGCAGGSTLHDDSDYVLPLDGPPRWPTRSKKDAHKDKFMADSNSKDPKVAALVRRLSERVWPESQ